MHRSSVTIQFQLHQQPAVGLLPAGLLDRFYLRLGDFRRLRRLSDAVVLFLVWFGYILAVALLPLFLLPLLLPLPAAAESREQINDMLCYVANIRIKTN